MLGGILNASKKLAKEYVLENLDFKNEDTIIDVAQMLENYVHTL